MKSIFLSIAFFLSYVTMFSQTPTSISGITGDSLIKDIGVVYFNSFWDNDFNPIRWMSVKANGKSFHEQIIIHTFRTGEITAVNNKAQKIFITPGDSVFFVTDTLPNNMMEKRVVFKFSGKNAAHYNYGYLSDTVSSPFFGKGDDVMAYKDRLLKIRDGKYAFLEKYKQEHSVSNEFYEYAKADIKNKYIRDLYLPLLSGRDRVDLKEIPTGYFDDDLHPVNELSGWYPATMLYRYIDFYSENIWQDMDAIYKNIITSFSGNERAYLVSALIGRFAEKQLPDYRLQLMNIIQEAPRYVKDSLYLDYIERANMFYSFVNNPFPEEVRCNTLFKEYGTGEVLSLHDVLQKYANKPVYIDFWASWCGPCIGEIENSQEAKVYLKEKGVEYIYFAFNDRENAWKNASERLEITANQYMLLDSNKSPLVDYLKLKEIPRYIILDTDHKIISGKAPHPIPYSFNELKDCISKCFEKPVLYY